jgi:hypothetical protein
MEWRKIEGKSLIILFYSFDDNIMAQRHGLAATKSLQSNIAVGALCITCCTNTTVYVLFG